jgi:SAM-dependent methyltransferase
VVRFVLLHVLSRIGLLPTAIRGWEHLVGPGAREAGPGPDGAPIPPSRLRYRVVGNTDLDFFFESGHGAEQTLRAALEHAGAPLSPNWAILDFGCGCGRVLRRWRDHKGRVCGSDFNVALAKWCQANLPFAEVGVNGLLPPLDYDDESFELIYAISVFTHLPVDAQLAWRDELRRIARPGGHLLMTLHSDAYTDLLKAHELQAYADGQCVVRWPSAAGANICSTYHPAAFVRDRLALGWELVQHAPRAVGSPGQDLVVLRKPLAVALPNEREKGLAG